MRVLRIAVAVALAAVTLGVLAAPSSAYTRFSGTCSFSGYSKFWPGREWVPKPSGYHYKAFGTCDGKLNGKPFKGKALNDTNADMHQPMGCAAGGSTYGGPVYITFFKFKKSTRKHKNPVLLAWTDEVNIGPTITTDLWGSYRGFAYGRGTLHTSGKEFPQCLGEDGGVPGLILSTTYTTVTELRG